MLPETVEYAYQGSDSDIDIDIGRQTMQTHPRKKKTYCQRMRETEKGEASQDMCGHGIVRNGGLPHEIYISMRVVVVLCIECKGEVDGEVHWFLARRLGSGRDADG